MIVREPREADTLTHIHTAALGDGRLSYKARGILAYLLSRPPGWQTSVEQLACGVDGERAIKSGIKELVSLGYLNGDGVTDTPEGPAPAEKRQDPPREHSIEAVTGGDPAPRESIGGWYPSEQALKTARKVTELEDIPLSIARYVIRKAEMKQEPSSSEWLRWLIADEKEAKERQREKAEALGQKRKWFQVAD